MDKLFTKLLALFLAACLVPVFAFAEDAEGIQEPDNDTIKDLKWYFALEAGVTEEKDFWDYPAFGLIPGPSYKEFVLGKSTSFPVDLLLLLRKDMDPSVDAEAETKTLIRITYTDDQARTIPVEAGLSIHHLEWYKKNDEFPEIDTTPDVWPEKCRAQNADWDSVALSQMEIMDQYELFCIVADELECPTDLQQIKLNVEFHIDDAVYQMEKFPIEFKKSEEEEEEGQPGEGEKSDDGESKTDESEEPSEPSEAPVEGSGEENENPDTSENSGETDNEPAADPEVPQDNDSENVNPEQTQDNEKSADGNEPNTENVQGNVETGLPEHDMNSENLRRLQSYLVCLGYLPQEYMAVTRGNIDFDYMMYEAIKQYQADYEMTVDGLPTKGLSKELEDIIIKEKKEEKDKKYNQPAFNQAIARELVALGYLEPGVLETLETDATALYVAIQQFKADYNIETTDSMSVELISALDSAMPTVSPAPTPAPTPVPLTVLSEVAPHITERQDMFMHGTAPAGAVVLVCCDTEGRRVILGDAVANEQGSWNFTITDAMMDEYLEDRDAAQIYVIQTVSATQGNDVSYNATPAAVIEDLQFFRHGDELLLIGQTKPHMDVVVDGAAYGKSDKDGRIELALSVAPGTRELTVHINSDADHPQTIDIKNEKAKALFKFLQPIPEAAELIVVLVLLVAFFLLLFRKVKKKAASKRIKGTSSLKQKGGSTHA